jgi:hypothetical protein
MASALVSARSVAIALSVLLAGPAMACKSDSDKESMDGDHDAAGDESDAIGTPSGATCPQDNKPTYDTFGKAFMEDYCVRCHSSKLKGDTARNGSPVGHDFDLLPGILPVAEHIDEYAAAGPDSVNTRMPPNGDKPSMEERELLGQWLACELDALNK